MLRSSSRIKRFLKRQIKEMTDDELKVALLDLKSELFNLRFRHATGQLENPMQIPECKKNIARVMTLLREKELNKVRNTNVGR